ncbi:hypothetical protein Q3G72_008639 [Acer saccharum]|nr:hypothetical protein Q3G72_008639 [Acer saccharum]
MDVSEFGKMKMKWSWSAGLHVGHPLGYTATDILARLQCFAHPMGWDAFGLPAEQYAIETGTHPKITTLRNINCFCTQVILGTHKFIGSRSHILNPEANPTNLGKWQINKFFWMKTF